MLLEEKLLMQAPVCILFIWHVIVHVLLFYIFRYFPPYLLPQDASSPILLSTSSPAVNSSSSCFSREHHPTYTDEDMSFDLRMLGRRYWRRKQR